MRPSVLVIGLLFLPLLPAHTRSAQQETNNSREIRYTEGFEGEPILGEIHPGWERVAGPEYPDYNRMRVRQDPNSAFEGAHYLRMTTQGANTGLLMSIGKSIIINTRFSYVISAQVRLKNTRNNSAVIAVRWLDRFARVLSESRSAPVTNALGWAPMKIRVSRIPPDTRWAQISLLFLGNDYRGECHIDDIRFVGQPRIGILPHKRITAIFHKNEIPRFHITPPLLEKTPPPMLICNAVDAQGNNVFERKREILGPNEKIDYQIPLPPGYFELTCTILRGGKQVACQVVPFCVLGDVSPGKSNLFGLVVNPFKNVYQDIPTAVNTLGVRHSKIVIWDRLFGGRNAYPTLDEIHQVIRQLIESNAANIIGIFGQPTSDAFPNVDHGTLEQGSLAVFSSPEMAWRDKAATIASRLGEWIFLWQIGNDDDPRVTSFTGARESIEALRNVLKGERRISSICLPVPVKALGNWKNPDAEVTSVYLSETAPLTPPTPPNQHHYVFEIPQLRSGPRLEAQNAQTSNSMKRVIELLTHVGTEHTIFLPLSLSDKSGLLDSEGHPRPPLLGMRTINALLAGTQPLRDFHIFQPPVEDRVFVTGNTAVIAFWSEDKKVPYNLYLGPGAALVDPMGTVRPLGPGDTVIADKVPNFLTGVNTLLLRTQSSFQFYNPAPKPRLPDILNATLPVRTDQIPKLIKMTNHFKEPIENVRIQILEERLPNQWKVQPLQFAQATILPDRKLRRSLLFTLPQTTTDGPVSFFFRVAFTHKGKTYEMVLERTLQVASEIQIKILQEKVGEKGRRITINIVNNTLRSITAQVHSRVPRQTERPTTQSGIHPGDGLKPPITFFIPDITAIPPTQRFVRVSVQERMGRIFANRTEKIE